MGDLPATPSRTVGGCGSCGGGESPYADYCRARDGCCEECCEFDPWCRGGSGCGGCGSQWFTQSAYNFLFGNDQLVQSLHTQCRKDRGGVLCKFPNQRPPGDPVVNCGMPAPRYPVPHPTPLPTAYTYFTYPPLMPHHALPHYRGTYSFRHGPGLSRTNVCWRTTHVANLIHKVHHVIERPR
jgi:hypothetical protein